MQNILKFWIELSLLSSESSVCIICRNNTCFCMIKIICLKLTLVKECYPLLHSKEEIGGASNHKFKHRAWKEMQWPMVSGTNAKHKEQKPACGCNWATSEGFDSKHSIVNTTERWDDLESPLAINDSPPPTT